MFIEKRNQFTKEGRYFVILDETGFQKDVGFKRGYSKKGVRLQIENKNLKLGKNISVLAAINQSKLLTYSKQSTSFNRISFLEFLNKNKSLFPKKTVLVMDNASFHHSKEVNDLALQQGWDILYTPPYSPWFSPIEGVFSIVKNHYRKHQNIEDAFQTNLNVSAFFRHSWNLNESPHRIQKMDPKK